MAQMGGRSSIQILPLDLLAGVLHHVQQSDRLRFCALVNKRWRQAANMTTSTITLTADSQHNLDSLSAWLNSSSYASRIQSIQVAYKIAAAHAGESARPVLRIPFAVLKQLEFVQLQQCQVKFVSPAADATSSPAATAATMAAISTSPASPGFRSLRALTALSRLELFNTSLDLSELSTCTGLRHLQLCNVDPVAAEAATTVRGKSRQGGSQQAGVDLLSQLASALPQLTQLTHLNFRQDASMPWQCRKYKQPLSTFFASLSNMQQLKELILILESSHAADVAHIPTSLTLLHLHYWTAWGSSMMPQLQQMTQLQCLQLARPEHVDHAVLSNLTQLTCLSITDCPFCDSESVASLLSAVQHLKQLRHLDLTGCLQNDPPSLESYAALTASSQLTSLDITGCYVSIDACDYIFPDGCALTALVSIATCPDLLNSVSCVRRVVAACPTLRELVITADEGALAMDSEVYSALHGFSALTNLALVHVELIDQKLGAIAACSQLRKLKISTPADGEDTVSLAFLMELTQLTGLTKLSVYARMEEGVFEEDLVAADGVPGVHLQLQQAIAEYN